MFHKNVNIDPAKYSFHSNYAKNLNSKDHSIIAKRERYIWGGPTETAEATGINVARCKMRNITLWYFLLSFFPHDFCFLLSYLYIYRYKLSLKIAMLLLQTLIKQPLKNTHPILYKCKTFQSKYMTPLLSLWGVGGGEVEIPPLKMHSVAMYTTPRWPMYNLSILY